MVDRVSYLTISAVVGWATLFLSSVASHPLVQRVSFFILAAWEQPMKSAESGIVEVEQLIQELRQSFCQHMISLDLYLAGGQLQRVCGQLPNKSVFRHNKLQMVCPVQENFLTYVF